MLTEKGTLPIGVEKDGQVHKDFEIREQTIADTIAVYDEPDIAVRAEKNSAYLGLCILAGQVLSIGEIPEHEVTPDLLLGLTPADFNALSAAAARLEERRKSFLSEA